MQEAAAWILVSQETFDARYDVAKTAVAVQPINDAVETGLVTADELEKNAAKTDAADAMCVMAGIRDESIAGSAGTQTFTVLLRARRE